MIAAAQIANLISTVKDWGELNHRIETSHDGWIAIKDGRVNVVHEIERLPGLRYQMKREQTAMYTDQFFVMVTDEVGTLIELYLKSDGYADISLADFIEKCASE